MLRFENPFDISKDGQNPIIDGIRYNIRNSAIIKEEVENMFETININKQNLTALEILEDILTHLGYSLNELIISDEHELLNEIEYRFIER